MNEDVRRSVEAEVERLRLERAARPAPRNWTHWLPRELGVVADQVEPSWTVEVVRELLDPELKNAMENEPIASKLSVEQLSFFETFAESAPKKMRVEEEEPEEAVVGLTEEARGALDAVWKMDFGPDWANPFRTRLSRENCEAIGLKGYYEIVEKPMDLALARETEYASDADLRADLVLIAHNAAKYHPPDSPLIRFANELVAAYDAERERLLRE